MILVNNPGSWSHVYSPLLHAKWNGWTPTDHFFPFFLLPLVDPINASLLFALGYVLIWLWLMAIFYRKKIFTKI